MTISTTTAIDKFDQTHATFTAVKLDLNATSSCLPHSKLDHAQCWLADLELWTALHVIFPLNSAPSTLTVSHGRGKIALIRLR